mmetsp:Transcript_10818/g.29908  ORF Transcript_10818/g.29908 Transcript_10818/m.29908 type:complete len:543 (+) Transcript_10818:205-1833(+)
MSQYGSYSNNGGSYGSYSGGAGGGSGMMYGQSNFGSADQTNSNNGEGKTLRRRNVTDAAKGSSGGGGDGSKYRQRVKKLDFMFPKVDTEYTVQTDRGGIAFVIACVIIVILCLAETISWRYQNLKTVEHVVVDTSLGKRMQVNLNITFPALACIDVHVEVMDVAGDLRLNLDQSLITKTRLFANGAVIPGEQQRESPNKHRKQQEDVVKQIQSKPLPDHYCGPCFGAQAKDDQCCNTCDALLEAYKAKKWSVEDILETSEQCIREGRNNKNPNRQQKQQSQADQRHAKVTKGEGCNLVGHMNLNRVAGNFHIAMGEGIQRNGKLVHIFNPEETHNFNVSHIIHHLSFGGHHSKPFETAAQNAEETPLNNVAKIVEEKHGTTGLFQYFIKIVPTTYVTPSSSKGVDEDRRETNGFFFTERFRPLMKEYLGHHEDVEVIQPEEGDEHSDKQKLAALTASRSGKHSHHGHHNVKMNSVLPGVFFIYEIYPFCVEVRPNVVPLTHLLIRLMALIGGTLTIVQFVDGLLDKRMRKSGGGGAAHRMNR